MVKEMERSWSGAGAALEPAGAVWRTPPAAKPPRIPDGTQTRVRFPARDFQPVFITGTAKESWTQIPDCLEDLWSSLTPFVCATSAGTKRLSQKLVLSTYAIASILSFAK